MEITTTYAIEILGTVAFAISGSFAAMQKRLDPFGVLIIAFVTSIGGGTVRDLLLGDTPVAWMRDVNYCLLILVTSLLTIFFKTQIKKFKITLFVFPYPCARDSTIVLNININIFQVLLVFGQIKLT